MHADSFSTGGSENLPVSSGAKICGSLRSIRNSRKSKLLRYSDVRAVLAWGILGIGCNFTPARKILA